MKLQTTLTALGVLAVLAAPVFAQPILPPFNYDFELEVPCGTSATTMCPLVGPFTNLTDDGQDWLPDTNGTGSSNTGPTANGGADHNPGIAGGTYLYTETSGGTTGAEIKLLSPVFDITGAVNPTIQFWYHMFGSSMGTMHLDFIEPIQAGSDGITTTGATFTTAGPSAAFVPGQVGTQITISGSAMGNDGVYTIMTVLGPNSVDVMPPFVVAETGLTYTHEAVTLDVIPSWTDNQDLWQLQQVGVGGLIQFGGSTFQVIIRSVRGASFASDMAIDDFSFIDLVPNDVGVVSVDAPAGFINPAGMYPVTVTISNFGSATQTSIPVNFTVDGGSAITETYMGSIAPNGTDTFTFLAPADLSIPGYYTIAGFTTLPGDGNTGNDAASASVGTLPTMPISTFPYTEDFEANPGFWAPGGTNSTWAYGTPAKPVINSAASGVNCWVTGGLTGQYSANENSFLQSPPFDFTSLPIAAISFNIWWESEFSWDGAVLQSSIDGGMSWQNVGMFGDPGNWYTDTTISGLSWTGLQEGWSGRTTSNNGSGTWVLAAHELTGLGGQANVLLRFAFGSDGSVQWEGIAFDDITIFDASPPYPGTPGDDVQLGTGINAAPSSGLGNYVKTATALDLLNLGVISPTGTYDFQPFVLVAQPFMTGNPNPGGPFPPPIWIDTTQPFIVLVGFEPLLSQTILPGGVGYSALMPLGFAGQSFMFQAVAITPALFLTDGYEIQVQ